MKAHRTVRSRTIDVDGGVMQRDRMYFAQNPHRCAYVRNAMLGEVLPNQLQIPHLTDSGRQLILVVYVSDGVRMRFGVTDPRLNTKSTEAEIFAVLPELRREVEGR